MVGIQYTHGLTQNMDSFCELKSESPLSTLCALGQCRCKLYGTQQEEDPLLVVPDSQIISICERIEESQELVHAHLL